MNLKLHSVAPVISTADVRQSIDYYTQVLEFLPDFEFGEPVSYGGVKSGDVELYFALDPDFSQLIKEKNVHPEVFFWLGDADLLFGKHVANGALVIEPLSDRPWGARQYVLEDVNGYHLKFAQPI